MSELRDLKTFRRVAGLELNSLVYSGVLPKPQFENGRIMSNGQPVFDINGEQLFRRIPFRKGGVTYYADIATHEATGSPFLAIQSGLPWNPRELRKKAGEVARKKFKILWDKTNFVAYSYPKVALQFMRRGEEVLMLELYTWEEVPSLVDEKADPNFQRWSYVDEVIPKERSKRIESFRERLRFWDDIKIRRERFDIDRIISKEFELLLEPLPRLVSLFDCRELHFSLEDTDHHPCYELRGQLTGVWCVAASVQMLLDFYRYDYTQDRLADELGLGTRANPNGLPYARDGDVVTVIQDMSNQSLTANMNMNPNWGEFRSEIRANRPLVSFVPRHSRTVAGYCTSTIRPWFSFRGLLVYDPWPPTTGAITRFENFDTQTYRRTFTAQPTLV
ncbi:MAG: C39 family peptidase [Candidatus Thorarchaeota archaeon]